MPIRALLPEQGFSPEQMTTITAAFDACLRNLGLEDRTDPVVLVLARKLIELGKNGECDQAKLKDAALKWLRAHPM